MNTINNGLSESTKKTMNKIKIKDSEDKKNQKPKEPTNFNKEILDYRELAELVLQRFGIDGMENMSDNELLMEFSKLSHDDTEFHNMYSYPSGNITKAKISTRIEGIIWASLFAPEFVKVVINDNEFLNLWNKRKDMFIDRATRIENFKYVNLIKHILDRKDIYNENKDLRLATVLNVANEIFVSSITKIKNPPNFLLLLKELSLILDIDMKTMFNNLDINNKGEAVLKLK